MKKYMGHAILVSVSKEAVYVKLTHEKIAKTDSDLYPILYDLDKGGDVVGVEILL